MTAIELETLIQRVELQADQFHAGLRGVEQSLQRTDRASTQTTGQMSRGFQALTPAISAVRSALIGMGAAISVNTFIEFTRSSIAWADSLQELAERVGVSVEALQRLQQAGQLANVGQEQIATNLEMFTRRVGDAARGVGQFGGVLEANGIALRDQDGVLRSTTAIFEDYAQLVAGASSQQEALSLAVAGFGRSGADMVTVLRELGDETNKFHALTAGQVEMLGKYDDILGQVSQRLQFELKAGLVSSIAEAERIGAAFQTAASAIGSAVDAITSGFSEAQQTIGQAVTAINESIASLGSGISEEFGQKLQSAVESSAGATTGIAAQWLELYDYLYGRSVVPELVEGIGSEFARLPALVGGPSQAASDAATAAFDEMAAAAEALREIGVDLPLVTAVAPLGRVPQAAEASPFTPLPSPRAPRAPALEIAATVGPRQPAGLDATAHAADLDVLRQAGQAAMQTTRELTEEQTRLGDVTLENAANYQTAMEAGRIFARTTSSGIVDAISAGDSVSETFQNITRSIVEAVAEMLIFQAIMAAIGGPGTAAGGGTGLFGLFGLQHGGPARRGTPVIVGERGPELIVPRQDVHVFSNPDTTRMLAAGTMSAPRSVGGHGEAARIVVNVQNSAPNAEARAEQSQDDQGNVRIDIMIDEMTANNLRPGTATSKALRDRFGLQFQTRR